MAKKYMGVTALGSGRYEIRGKVRSERTGAVRSFERIVEAKSAAEAARLRSHLRSKLAAAGTAPARMRVIDYAASWLRSIGPEVSAGTLASYELACKSICESIGGVFLDAVTRADIVAWRQGLIDRGLKPLTINTWASTVRRVFSAAAEDHDLRDPTRRIRGLPTGGPPRRPLTPAELQALIAAAESLRASTSVPLRELITLLALTGLRVGEALALRWEDIDLAACTVRVQRTQLAPRRASGAARGPRRAAASRCTTGPTKGRVARVVPIPGPLRGQLAARHALLDCAGRLECGWVFPSPTGSMVDYSTANAAFTKAATAAGLKGITAHYLRHTYNDAARRVAPSLVVVQAITGHSGDDMTHHYSQVDHAEKAAVGESVARALLDRARG